MENKKQPNSVSVNSALHTRGLSDNSQNLEKLMPVSEESLSFWNDLWIDYLFYDSLSDFEFASSASSMMDFDHE